MADRSQCEQFNVGIVGAGYIADWHAQALCQVRGATVRAVCDVSRRAAETLAARFGVEHVYESLAEMLVDQSLDAAHVLVPPDHHAVVADRLLKSGVHVLLEKPMATTTQACRELADLAKRQGLALGVSHNFLFGLPYEKLREDVRSGCLGRLNHVTIDYFRELPQATFGPFHAWMLQHPSHIMLEIGPHLAAFLLDLVGEPDALHATVTQPKTLPAGVPFYRRWQIYGNCGHTTFDLNLSLGPAFEEFTVRARGALGTAVADLCQDTYYLDRSTAFGFDFDRYARVRRIGKTLRRQAWQTLRDYALTKLRLSKKGGPYLRSFTRSLQEFYRHLNAPLHGLDERLQSEFGGKVVQLCRQIGRSASIECGEREAPATEPRPVHRPPQPNVLVIGGSGFIGRKLVQQLVGSGRSVRVLARNAAAARFPEACEQLDIVRGDIRVPEQIDAALDGVECVYHLARAPEGKTWQEYVDGEITPTETLGRLCAQRGVKRLIYTGSIASYYMGSGAGTIGDRTPLDPRIHRRDYYPRCKAACEEVLLRIHREDGLGVVIFRPAIVIGEGGGPCHWGVGMWNGVGVCRIWGRGNHPLPFVLVEDVASAMTKAVDAEGIDGRVYNLSSPPLLTARQYAEAIEEQLGARIQACCVPIWRFYATDMFKWLLKVALRHPGAARIPSYRDWKSRTHEVVFDCAGARRDLAWNPTSDVDELIRQGIHKPLQKWLA